MAEKKKDKDGGTAACPRKCRAEKQAKKQHGEGHKTCCPAKAKATCPMKKAAAETKAEEAKAQTTCPVMGGKVNKKIYVDHEGKRVYFCCRGCVAKFKENPEKYLAKMKAAGVEPVSLKKAECAKCEKDDKCKKCDKKDECKECPAGKEVAHKKHAQAKAENCEKKCCGRGCPKAPDKEEEPAEKEEAE